MNATQSASVIVVSHGRPAELRRCLTAIAQLDHPEFEVIVVADAAGRAALADLGVAGSVKAVPFERANISQARNLGIEVAAGEIAAFIDDDAVPEPSWLSYLTAPFTDDRVAAAGGYVRGRNGITLQHRASWVDSLAHSHPLEVDETVTTLHQSVPGAAVKTEGTCMAFRRTLLARMGGFDPCYRFYLDETDLNLRLAQDEQITAVVPAAQVLHGVAASSRRRGDRVPTDLGEIGASSAVFLRKHAPEGTPIKARLAAMEREQRRRLLGHMVTGRLEPRDVGRLLEGFAEGIAAGLRREIAPLHPIGAPKAPFLRFPESGPRAGRVLAGWIWQGRRMRRTARAQVGDGAVVTVLRLSPSTFYHHVRFHPDGYWLQTGGLWGRSDRDQPLIRPYRFVARMRAEIARIAPFRPVDTLLG